MTEYCRTWHPGARWFFTMNLAERRGNRLLVKRIDVLRTAFRNVRARHPFHIEVIVILPDHLHCVWMLRTGDTDCSSRWSLIKGHFSLAIEKGERTSQSRAKRGERGLWQRRFWEHLIRDSS
jgi:putative transposase